MSSPDQFLTTRNATVADLATLLQAQHAAKLDVVTPARHLTVDRGRLRLIGVGEPRLTPDGVTVGETLLRPTAVADAGIADKLGIPLPYLRRLRAEQIGLYDANINTWLGDDPDRRFLVRGLHDPAGGTGVARALLSDSYRVVDNLDVLMAVLGGVRAAGVEVDIAGCDLTERRMYVKVLAPQVAEYAPELLADYRSPFTGARGADNPVVFAGFVVSNSETGHGSFSLTPQLTVRVCDNGMTITKDAMREVHLGGRLADGVVRWSADTEHTLLDLVVKQARDAVVDERAASARRVPPHSGQVVNVTARSTKARMQSVDVLGQVRLLDLRDQAFVDEVDAVDLDLDRLLVEQVVQLALREVADRIVRVEQPGAAVDAAVPTVDPGIVNGPSLSDLPSS